MIEIDKLNKHVNKLKSEKINFRTEVIDLKQLNDVLKSQAKDLE